jgi:hypothetical protein
MRKFFVSVSEELISQLIYCPAGHWKFGKRPKLATFALTDENSMMPVKVKIRDREKPMAGEIYRAFIYYEPRERFIDQATGQTCQSRDMWSIRLYVHTKDIKPEDYSGELHFLTFPIGSALEIFPEPVFFQTFTGVREQGALWIADPGTDYQIRREAQKDEVLFSGPVVVQISGPEENRAGSVAIKVNNGLVVYDRRSDRLSSFARAEHIRRAVGKRTFEFVNLRNISLGELHEDPAEMVLTNNGLEPVEE